MSSEDEIDEPAQKKQKLDNDKIESDNEAMDTADGEQKNSENQDGKSDNEQEKSNDDEDKSDDAKKSSDDEGKKSDDESKKQDKKEEKVDKETKKDDEEGGKNVDNEKKEDHHDKEKKDDEKQKGKDEKKEEEKNKHGDKKNDNPELDIHARLKKERKAEGESIMDFKFNKKRVEMISKEADVPDESQGILYWMNRDQRIEDNWALLFAQRLAIKNKLSLHIAYCLVPKYLDGTYRQFQFLLKGLEEVEKECEKINIEFHLLLGEAKEVLPDFIESHGIGGLVTDFSPLRTDMQWVQDVKKAIPSNIPMCRVDAHNIIPCWKASPKQEYSAKCIRGKLLDKLSTYLTKFPPVMKHPHESKFKAEPVDWVAADKFLEVDRSVEPVDWATPGTKGGHDTLNMFCLKRLRKYLKKSNDPVENALSNLSPWLHFGQISAQRCALEVKRYKKQLKDCVEMYLEELIIRRELTDNYCYYQKDYDNIEGAYSWARNTLNDHKDDKRPYLYTRETLDEAKTHDDLWNSAQIQLRKEGKMHGFMRMYWAKKILEWTKTPEDAIKDAIYLNDRYNLDGRDPNGYVGVMWSICGIHDQGWKERPIFGKIRYMNYDGCKRKFNIRSFVARYGGKEHKYIPPK